MTDTPGERSTTKLGHAVQPHTERLLVPWWWWPIGLALGAFLATEIGFGVPGVRTWLAYVLVIPLTLGALWWWGRIQIQVSTTELAVDDARITLEFIAAARPLHGAQRRGALGPELHPAAFVVQRPWIDGVVQIALDDPADPTPYWLVSSRDPDALAAIINRVSGVDSCAAGRSGSDRPGQIGPDPGPQ